MENFQGDTAYLEGIRPQHFLEQEKELLQQANRLTPGLPFTNLDLLIVDEMGKEISGTGMDTNVIGRYRVLGQPEPQTPAISRIYVRDLSGRSHGNANGIGLADFTHQRLIEKIDRQVTCMNTLTATGPEKAQLPPYFSQYRLVVKLCLASIGPTSPKQARIVRIKNTMMLEQFLASEALLGEIKRKSNLTLIGNPEPMSFDEEGNFNDRPFGP